MADEERICRYIIGALLIKQLDTPLPLNMNNPHDTSESLADLMLLKPYAESYTSSFNDPQKEKKNTYPDDSTDSYTDHDDTASQSSEPGYSKKRRSSRSAPSKAYRRAKHNATEKARRESMSAKFQELAEVLPNLQNCHRPSRGVIVEKALDWVKARLSAEETNRHQMQQLVRENKQLHMEIGLLHKPGMATCSSGTDIQNNSAQPPLCYDMGYPTLSPTFPTGDSVSLMDCCKSDVGGNGMSGDLHRTTSNDCHELGFHSSSVLLLPGSDDIFFDFCSHLPPGSSTATPASIA